ncbi:MAG: hypothetical protein AB4040_07795 [Synechococcus sp.]
MVDKQELESTEVQGEWFDSYAPTNRSIRSPGCIQPQGFLVGVRLEDLSIRYVSSNSDGYIDLSPQQLLGQTLEQLLTADQIELLLSLPVSESPSRALLAQITFRNRPLDMWVHHSDGDLILELEPIATSAYGVSIQTQISCTTQKVQRAADIQALLDTAVAEAKLYTGCDRAIAFRFDDNGSGSVVAEVTNDRLPSYKGRRFPAVDVPQEARELYARCPSGMSRMLVLLKFH